MEMMLYIDSASRFALKLIISQLGRNGFFRLAKHSLGSQTPQHPSQFFIFSAGSQTMEAEEYYFLLCLAPVFS